VHEDASRQIDNKNMLADVFLALFSRLQNENGSGTLKFMEHVMRLHDIA
jgi:hypothetical protein